jgi:hypothetical protein
MTTSAIATLITPLIGRTVISTDKTGAESRYTISKLSDKLATLKDGSKGEYVILTKDGETGVVINMHPNTAKKLAKKGEGDNFVLAMALTQTAEPKADPVVASTEPAADLSAAEQTDVKAELAAAQSGAPAADMPPKDEAPVPAAKAAKEPSKKDRTIAIFKSMAGGARKDIIAKMKTDLGLSDAGANTYYQNCKSGAWA